MKISRIEHLGIAVQSIDAVLPYFRDGVHHVAFKVEDGVSEALAMCDEKGLRLIDKSPRQGADGLHIAFLHPKSTCGILTELCEE